MPTMQLLGNKPKHVKHLRKLCYSLKMLIADDLMLFSRCVDSVQSDETPVEVIVDEDQSLPLYPSPE